MERVKCLIMTSSLVIGKLISKYLYFLFPVPQICFIFLHKYFSNFLQNEPLYAFDSLFTSQTVLHPGNYGLQFSRSSSVVLICPLSAIFGTFGQKDALVISNNISSLLLSLSKRQKSPSTTRNSWETMKRSMPLYAFHTSVSHWS